MPVSNRHHASRRHLRRRLCTDPCEIDSSPRLADLAAGLDPLHTAAASRDPHPTRTSELDANEVVSEDLWLERLPDLLGVGEVPRVVLGAVAHRRAHWTHARHSLRAERASEAALTPASSF